MKSTAVFWTLFKVRLQASFSSFSGSANNPKRSRGKTILFVLLMLYVYGIFFVMFLNFFGSLADPMHGAGLDWLYFTLYGMTSLCIMFICSVFATKTQLYDATDNELLLSMPIPPKDILASRMAMLIVMNLLFGLMTGIPALVMWLRVTEMSAAGLTAFILLLLALPFFSLAVSSLIGWLIALTTDRARSKSLITVLISVVFLALYFLLVSQANVYIQKLVSEKAAVAASLGKSAPLFWFGNAISAPDILQLVWMLLILLVPFVLIYIVLSRTFISVATKNRGAAKVKYRARTMHATSVEKALLQREKKHLLSSSVYLLNAGLGILFLYAGGVFLLFERQKMLASLSATGISGDQLGVFAVLAAGLISAMVLFTAPSVSLEGKTIWIVKSLPLTPRQILHAKLQLHRRATLPAVLFLMIVCACTLDIPTAMKPGLILAPCCIVWLSSSVGLIAGLKHANLDWINETQVVKQGMAVLLAMLFSALLVILPFFVYSATSAAEHSAAFLYSYTALLAAGSYFADHWIDTKGAVLFEDLG